MKTKLILLFILLLTLSGCSKSSDESKSKPIEIESSQEFSEIDSRTIVDSYGREVEIPNQINSIICTGSGALRLASYLKATDLVVAVEETDKNNVSGVKRDYSYVYQNTFSELPVIGKGGGTSYTAYPEEIIKLNPDVIFTCYSPEALAQLEREVDIPIVSIRYISQKFVHDSFYSSLKILADAIDKVERSDELISYINEVKSDLNSRTHDIIESEKPSVYTGAVTFSGAHGFSGTYSNFGPFTAINAKNVADRKDEEGFYEVDLEQLIIWDPEIIFVDPGNIGLVNDEYSKNTGIFHTLQAVEKGRVYTMPSFNNYSTNITYCLMDGYYAGKVIYPERFLDIEMEEIGKEILFKFLGRNYFDDMEANGLYYGEISIGEQ